MKLILTIVFVLFIFQGALCEKEGESRIIDGRPVREGDLPFMLSIQVNGIHFCGGTLLTSLYLLTTATCVENFPHATKNAVAGAYRLNIYSPRPSRNQQIRPVNEWFPNPNYMNDNGANNLAIGRAMFPFSLDNYVLPIPLPTSGLTDGLIPYPAIIAGWGVTSTTTFAYSDVLQKGVVSIHSKSACAGLWSPTTMPPFYSDTDICAGVLKGTPSACAGDEGGPLALEISRGRFMLVGIYRYGLFACGAAGKPSVFVDISNPDILTWIDSIITT